MCRVSGPVDPHVVDFIRHMGVDLDVVDRNDEVTPPKNKRRKGKGKGKSSRGRGRGKAAK